ncbi:3-phosphoshikimate 1-carboxyvinyltransferase [uncultured Faecalibaculum sp.]|uniref:3-phosphoshikimate 1-carboxyvinyltransferase n=1 Tax=uncultured Faecalibaculum sp. TaxID=1729681 RepID=UPI00261166F8|nr:3-phosphoshikimate 1-carboxyvinyltransferase [uncultured Faecalibaculum sp.]
MNQIIHPACIQGTLALPPSKSMAHRLMICAGLAAGTSRISGLRDSKDMQATLQCLKALGARISGDFPTLEITGCDPASRMKQAVLDCNESGSTLRFLIPCTALSPAPAVFTGKGRLMERPMGVYADVFLNQGLRFEQGNGEILVQGPLQPGLFEIPGNVSSQFISGLLFAAGLMPDTTKIAVLPPYESRDYVHMTVSALKAFGICVTQPTDHGYVIPGHQAYRPRQLQVEGDWSQAAFPAVFAALKGSVNLEGLNRDSLQGDKVIADILQLAGASLSWHSGTLTIAAPDHPLQPLDVDLGPCPDLGPALCVLASFIPGTSIIRNAGRLRIKESDRIAAMEEELKKWGVRIASTEDTITIQGALQHRQSQPVTINSHNDHRIAMAMAVFGWCAASDSVIEDAGAVTKSWPDFFGDMQEVLK